MNLTPLNSLVLPCAAATLVLVPTLTGCGDAPSSTASSASVQASSAERRHPDPKAQSLRQLIGEGRADLARPILESLQADIGVERPLLEARLSFLEGNGAEWLTLVEEARALDVKDPRPYATAAEIYAAMGRTEAAREEIRLGAEVAGGMTPELQRAQGVVAIVTPGAAKAGLGLLKTALRADPDLPFMARPLGQAYYLNAGIAFASDAGQVALEHIEKSVQYDPEDHDARLLYGQLLIAEAKDVVKGLDVLEALYADGEPIVVELGRQHWRAGLIAQVQQEPDIAVKHYLRARELGCPDVEEGVSRTFLRDEAQAATTLAIEAARAGNEETVRALTARAVALRKADEKVVRSELAMRLAAEASKARDRGHLDECSRLIGAALHADPSASGVAEVHCALYQSKTIQAMEEKDAESAIRYAREAAQIRPDNTLSWQMLGELQYGQGDFDAAAKSLLKAVANARLDGEPLGAAVSQKLAECQHLSRDKDGAIATLEQALRDLTPEEAELRPELDRYLALLTR